MGQGRPLGAKLFLEGIEVPFIGATFTSQVNTASIAYVDLVPHSSINNIKPRTHVLIAVRDYLDKENGFPYVTAWEGEVFGTSFNKTPSSRSFSLSCIDYSSYWDNIIAYFFNAQTLNNRAGTLSKVGQDYVDMEKQGLSITSVAASTSSFFRKTMDDALLAGKDLLQAFVAIIEEIGGINDFYKLAMDRLKLNNRLFMKSSGALNELVRAKEARDWFDGLLGNESGITTLRNVINDLLSIIFHDFVSVPFAPASSDGNPMNFVFKPNLYMIPPPACNIFYPEEYSSFTYNRNFFREPTRLIYRPELPLQDAEGHLMYPHAYSPPSFSSFMMKDGRMPVDRLEAMAVDVLQGNFGDADSKNNTNISKIKREPQFLTVDEWYRGILMASEENIPSSSEFTMQLKQAGKTPLIQRVADYLLFKKRFETREFSITGHLKLSVVPGFTALVLDNSDAGQNTIAYVNSVTHRIYATEGGYTTVNFGYARGVGETQTTDSPNDPPIPPWYDETVFGKISNAPVTPEQQETVGVMDNGGKKLVASSEKAKAPSGNAKSMPALSYFYSSILGGKGNTALTDMYSATAGGNTLIGATAELLKEYRNYKATSGADIMDFIKAKSSRDYMPMEKTFEFMGAKTTTKDFMNTSFSQFNGPMFAKSITANIASSLLNQTPSMDEQVKAGKRAIIQAYRDILKANRGFKG